MMNDLVLSEDGHAIQADDYHDDEDWYETRPGDEISNHGNSKRLRRGRLPFYMIICGALLVIIGISVAFSSGGDDSGTTMKSQNSGNTPTGAPTSFEEGVFDFLTDYVDEKVLMENDSYTFKAYSWLMKNSDIRSYGQTRIRQRFALAAIYYATNAGLNSWVNKDKWLSDADECKWHGVQCRSGGTVVALNFTSNGLTGVFPEEITVLRKQLLGLELGDNDLVNENQQLRWMGQMTNLRLLDIEDTSFTANGVPSYIGKMTDLRVLDIANTNFIGEFDGSIFQTLTELEYLDIGGIPVNDTLPLEVVTLPKLKALYAYECGIEGEVSNFIHRFKTIYELWMDLNALTGTIPSEIGLVTNLASLSISDNAMKGQLPTELGLLTKMEQMWIYGNYFDGSIPTEIGRMTDLQILGLEDNDFSGISMPSQICALGLEALGADCVEDVNCPEGCCTCCQAPCEIKRLQKGGGSDVRRNLYDL